MAIIVYVLLKYLITIDCYQSSFMLLLFMTKEEYSYVDKLSHKGPRPEFEEILFRSISILLPEKPKKETPTALCMM